MWRKASLTPADSFIILALTIGLLVSLFILMKPYPAGQVGLLPSINVVATAQAMQTHRQQAELETAHQSQKAVWAAELAKKRQELFQANQQGQAQIVPLQAQLSDVQSQINQTQANLQIMSQKIMEIQQTIQADEAAYQNQLAVLKADLEQAQPQPTIEPANLLGTSPPGVDYLANPTSAVSSADHESASSSPAPANTPAAEGDKHNNEPENNSSNQHDNSSHSNQDSHPQTDDNAKD
jgi:hypothetical protein